MILKNMPSLFRQYPSMKKERVYCGSKERWTNLWTLTSQGVMIHILEPDGVRQQWHTASWTVDGKIAMDDVLAESEIAILSDYIDVSDAPYHLYEDSGKSPPAS